MSGTDNCLIFRGYLSHKCGHPIISKKSSASFMKHGYSMLSGGRTRRTLNLGSTPLRTTILLTISTFISSGCPVFNYLGSVFASIGFNSLITSLIWQARRMSFLYIFLVGMKSKLPGAFTINLDTLSWTMTGWHLGSSIAWVINKWLYCFSVSMVAFLRLFACTTNLFPSSSSSYECSNHLSCNYRRCSLFMSGSRSGYIFGILFP